jgi:hypothetical protein
MKNKIWYDMVHTKYGSIYLALYLHRQKAIRKWATIMTLIFSGSGVFGWTIWTTIPVICCVLVSAIQLFRLIENKIILSDEEISKIGNLLTRYNAQFNELEKLWGAFFNEKITEDEATEQFYKLRQISAGIDADDNKLHINGKIKKLADEANKKTTDYINQYHT